MAAAGDLDWDDLRFFLHSARAGSLSGAARSLGMQHTTVGRRLDGIESTFGIALFIRGPEGLRLTELGAQIAPKVEEIERAVEAISNLISSQSTRIRVATPSGFTKVFSESLSQLRKRHPRISLEMVGGARAVDLRRGEADIALRVGPVTDDDLVVRKLCDVGFSLYASQTYLARRSPPRDLNDLSGHDIIGYDPLLADSALGRWLTDHSAGATVVLRSREMTDVLSAAASGIGVALLPCILGDGAPDLQRLTPDVLVSHSLFLVYRRETRVSAEVRAVSQFLIYAARQNAGALAGEHPSCS